MSNGRHRCETCGHEHGILYDCVADPYSEYNNDKRRHEAMKHTDTERIDYLAKVVKEKGEAGINQWYDPKQKLYWIRFRESGTTVNGESWRGMIDRAMDLP